MKPWLFTPYERRTGQGVSQVLSIFVATSRISLDDLDGDLVNQLQRVGPVDAIHFVGYGPEISEMRRALASHDTLLDRLQEVTGGKSNGLMFFSFDPDSGSHTCTDRAIAKIANASQVISEERRHSLISVFRNAGGEEQAPIGTHYAKTSDRHCDRFLRVSNVLEDGNNVRLLAFWLMPHLWKMTVRNVVVDTSGIYSVALTAIAEAQRLGGISDRPHVWSHRSHEGVDEVPARIVDDALFIVSASTSNGLVRKLQGRGVQAGRIVTLFSLAEDATDGHTVVCHLNGDGQIGLRPIQNQKATECLWCRQHFHLIGIRGDQFSIAPPRITTVEIRGADLQDKVRSSLSGLMGLRAFVAYRRRDGDRLCSLGIDVSPILNGSIPERSLALVERVREKWSSMTRRSQTTTLRNVVSTSYPRSSELAASLVEAASTKMADSARPQLVEARDLRELPAVPATSTIAVSACVDESQELLSVSRVLRDVQEGGTTTYLTVVQLLASKQLADRLKSNLTFGVHGPETFSYFSALEIPVDAYEEIPSWRAELVSLQRVRSWADTNDLDVPVLLEERIDQLTKAPARGLIDDLFWPDIAGQPLRLRSDFTLVDGALREPCASQADLYAIMCVVLNFLRHNEDASRRLAHNAYQRGVLSPSNFDRFNDGVLQACVLRAARPKELAYAAGEEQLSEQMLGVLMDGLPSAARPEKSEAMLEFLVALMTGRMTLAHRQLDAYLSAVEAATSESWPLAAVFARYIRATGVGPDPALP